TARARSLAIGVVLFACAGCQLPSPTWHASTEPVTEARSEIPDADNPLVFVQADPRQQIASRPPRLVYELAVLHILVPREQAGAMEKVWNFLREDGLDAETRLRLGQNGLRVGVGHVQDWQPIKAAMDAIEDHRVTSATPLSVPVGFPLSLELDSEPREQTLFYVGPDGILSGSIWPDSRNVLRVTYAPDLHDVERVRLLVVPEVHQRQHGWEWVRTEAGLWQVPRQAMQTFDAAAFVLTLSPGEFVLLAPSANARIYGLVGGAFLTRTSEGRNYNSYVFLRPEARHVGQHD
ncbi:MAG: hypothetical protein ACE5I3_14615, partial [Phycisphaerae bacterium]